MLDMGKVKTEIAHSRPDLSPEAVWTRVCEEALKTTTCEPVMAALARAHVLRHANLSLALGQRLSECLSDEYVTRPDLRDLCFAAYAADPDLLHAACADLLAVLERDPATHRLLQPFLFFKGFRAIQAHRVAHWAMQNGRQDLAFFIQMRVCDLFAIDIHPAARIGAGLLMDHAHGIVIGETASIGNNVTLLHSVTLGSTGRERGARHPSIGDNVVIGAGAKVLGNIHIGNGAKIAAGSVVLRNVPENKTVVGVPGRILTSRDESLPVS